MSFDPFAFTPPSLNDLAAAVETAQQSAVCQAMEFYREDERPSSTEFAAAARNGRHLTAMQRTFRMMSGPLFDPDSPLSPIQRYKLFERRVEKVQAAYADPDNPSPRPLRFETRNGQSDRANQDAPSPLPVLNADFCPPDIQDLCDTADFLSKCARKRWREILKGRRCLTTEERSLEVRALRDLTAIFRTLYRMSAHAISEDQTHGDLKKEFREAFDTEALTSTPSTENNPSPSSIQSVPSGSSESRLSETSVMDPSPPSTENNPSPSSIQSAPSGSSESRLSETSVKDPSPSGISNFKSGILPSDADADPPIPNNQSVLNQHAVRSIPAVPEIRPTDLSHRTNSEPSPPSMDSLASTPSTPDSPPTSQTQHNAPNRRSSREHGLPSRDASPPASTGISNRKPGMPSTHSDTDLSSPSAPTHTNSPQPSSPCRVRPKTNAPSGKRGRWSALYREDDDGPWGIWDTPPPGAIDESSPQFLEDLKSHGYEKACRLAIERLRAEAFSSDPSPPHPTVFNDSSPPPDDP